MNKETIKKEENNTSLRLSKRNLYFIAAGLVVVIIGFVLMAVGPDSGLHNFEPDIFSTRRVIVAPLIVFIGYVSILFAIWYKPKKSEDKQKRHPYKTSINNNRPDTKAGGRKKF